MFDKVLEKYPNIKKSFLSTTSTSYIPFDKVLVDIDDKVYYCNIVLIMNSNSTSTRTITLEYNGVTKYGFENSFNARHNLFHISTDCLWNLTFCKTLNHKITFSWSSISFPSYENCSDQELLFELSLLPDRDECYIPKDFIIDMFHDYLYFKDNL